MKRSAKIAIISGVAAAVVVAVVLAVVLTVVVFKEDSARAKVAFSHQNNVQSSTKRQGPTTTAPSYLGIKFVAVYLSESIDETYSNTGKVSLIYLNPECEGSINGCGVSGEDRIIESYFNFTAPTDQVNQEINAQYHPVHPGTYAYIRLEFCKGSPGAPNRVDNTAFMAGNMTAVHSFPTNMCAQTFDLVPPISVTSSDTVTVTLGYDLENLVNVTPTPYGSDSCTNTSPSYCLGSIQFNATATLNN